MRNVVISYWFRVFKVFLMVFVIIIVRVGENNVLVQYVLIYIDLGGLRRESQGFAKRITGVCEGNHMGFVTFLD